MRTWFLDTTYILPFFGIPIKIPKIRNQLAEILTKKHREIAISTCSLIEGKWKALHSFNKTNNKGYLERANKALESFQSNQYIQIFNPWNVLGASYWADQLYINGHTDYMDCWIAGTAKAAKRVLVTEDDDLTTLIRNLHEWETTEIVTWNDFVNEIL